MVKTFRDMVNEGREAAEVITPQQAQQRVQQNPKTLIIDVREPSEVATGAVDGSINVPLGVLPIKADTQLAENVRDARLQEMRRGNRIEVIRSDRAVNAGPET